MDELPTLRELVVEGLSVVMSLLFMALVLITGDYTWWWYGVVLLVANHIKNRQISKRRRGH